MTKKQVKRNGVGNFKNSSPSHKQRQTASMGAHRMRKEFESHLPPHKRPSVKAAKFRSEYKSEVELNKERKKELQKERTAANKAKRISKNGN